MILRYLYKTNSIILNLSLGGRYMHAIPFYCNENRDPKAREPPVDRSRLRNIGIIAHINAGKTTTTERILYYSGSIKTVGDVDRGNTVTDYLSQERDRGITITSAAVTCYWKRHRINLIDTPGHVDFSMEVERSLAVTDGVVTILDASAGVEAQTVTVWNQAAKYQLPQIIFLNKCDKAQADYKMCMNDLKRNLDTKASLIQLPIEIGPKGGSLIDLIDLNHISWEDTDRSKGVVLKVEPLENLDVANTFLEPAERERANLVNTLADIDDEIAGHVIECDEVADVPGWSIRDALRRTTRNCKLCPVLVGSSFRYIGVQNLMDAIVSYLPSPIDRGIQVRNHFGLEEDLTDTHLKNSAFIFKIMHDGRLGPLTYMRVLSGNLSRSQRLESLESGKQVQIKKAYRVFADELQEMDRPFQTDDILVASGLNESRTGDILVNLGYRGHQRELEKEKPADKRQPFRLLGQPGVLVPQIDRMEPVYFCSIEAPSSGQQMKLETALANLAREDPSFTYEADNRSGSTTIRGMGKLHLDVIRDRIQSDYNIDCQLGPLQIAYLETIQGSATEELTVDRVFNGHRNVVSLSVKVWAKNNAGHWTTKKLRLNQRPEGDRPLDQIRQDHRKAIEQGFLSALNNGPSLGCPLVDCEVMLMEFQANGRCSLPIISSAASQCLSRAIRRCSPLLLEPIMLLEVLAPADTNGQLQGDLARRRARILSTEARNTGQVLIKAQTPLAELANYAEFLRVASSGRATFSMELANYTAMSEADRLGVARG